MKVSFVRISWKHNFGCTGFVGLFFYPETKGKTLEQMDELFGDQLVPHALSDPLAAEAATGKGDIEHVEVERKD